MAHRAAPATALTERRGAQTLRKRLREQCLAQITRERAVKRATALQQRRESQNAPPPSWRAEVVQRARNDRVTLDEVEIDRILCEEYKRAMHAMEELGDVLFADDTLDNMLLMEEEIAAEQTHAQHAPQRAGVPMQVDDDTHTGGRAR
ncbi:hypothetical protein MSPP1_000919 [Malassezia sp. CBS 17886]|nr:hypothetical protein MSPP1_000919 [Malassezia sp. CBS 17886]